MKASYTLNDVKAERVVIECSPCHRRGSYATAKLIEQYGADTTLPDLKDNIVNASGCPNRSLATLVGCKARFSEETMRSWLP